MQQQQQQQQPARFHLNGLATLTGKHDGLETGVAESRLQRSTVTPGLAGSLAGW